jgi:hypothetical protein
MEIEMKSKKLFLIGFIILAITVFSMPSHASGGVFGKIGIYDYPWNISIGYNDYGHGYRQPHYVEHHHYRGHYSDYRPHHDYGHGYCRH